jgi:hypothetical protein
MWRSITVDAARLQHGDHGLPRDAVQEGVRQRRVDDPVLHEEHVGARRLGNVAAPVHHDRVRAALRLGGVLGHGADHVEPRSLGEAGDRLGRGTLPPRCRASPPSSWRRRNRRPTPRPRSPCGPGCATRRRPCRAPSRARSAPGHRRPRSRSPPGRRVFAASSASTESGAWMSIMSQEASSRSECSRLLKIVPAIGALALEDRARIVQRVGEHVHLSPRARARSAVHPDDAVPIVVGSCRHGSLPQPRFVSFDRGATRPIVARAGGAELALGLGMSTYLT